MDSPDTVSRQSGMRIACAPRMRISERSAELGGHSNPKRGAEVSFPCPGLGLGVAFYPMVGWVQRKPRRKPQLWASLINRKRSTPTGTMMLSGFRSEKLGSGACLMVQGFVVPTRQFPQTHQIWRMASGWHIAPRVMLSLCKMHVALIWAFQWRCSFWFPFN